MRAAAASLGPSRRGAFGASLALHAAVAALLLKPLAYAPPIRPAVPDAMDVVWLDAGGEAAAERATADGAPSGVADAPPETLAVLADPAPPPAPPPVLAALPTLLPPPMLPPMPPPPSVAPPVAVPQPPLPQPPEQPAPTQLVEMPPAPSPLAAAPPLPPATDAAPQERVAEHAPPLPPPPAPAVTPRPARTHTAARPTPPRNAATPAAARHAAQGGAEAAAGSAAAVAAAAAAAPSAPPGPVLITAPRYRRPPTPPAYPPRALEFGLTGTVLIRARIRPDGTTEETRIWRSSGHVLLDAAALAAVRRWDFEPAAVDGRRVEAWVEVPVHFRLN